MSRYGPWGGSSGCYGKPHHAGPQHGGVLGARSNEMLLDNVAHLGVPTGIPALLAGETNDA